MNWYWPQMPSLLANLQSFSTPFDGTLRLVKSTSVVWPPVIWAQTPFDCGAEHDSSPAGTISMSETSTPVGTDSVT